MNPTNKTLLRFSTISNKYIFTTIKKENTSKNHSDNMVNPNKQIILYDKIPLRFSTISTISNKYIFTTIEKRKHIQKSF